MKRSLALGVAALLCTALVPMAHADQDDIPPPAPTAPGVVDELTDEYNLTIANGDGTYTLTSSREAQRVERDGDWVNVDTSISEDADGRLSTVATLADMSFSAGGDGPLAVTSIDGKELAFSLPFTLPTPSVDGDTLTYPDVLPDVDLVVRATAEAFSEVLVVKTAEAAALPELATLDLVIAATGLAVEVNADGSTVAVDEDGEEVFFSAPPTMWDSTPDAAGNVPDALTPGDNQVVMDTTVAEQTAGRSATAESSTTITLEPESDVLVGPEVTYPVYIDPSFSAARLNFTVVRNNAPTYANNTDVLRVGYCGFSDCSPKYSARSYFNFSTATLAHRSGQKATVHGASIAMTQIHNGSGSATGVQLHKSNPFTTTMAWPGTITTHLQTVSAAGTAQLNFDSAAITSYLQEVADAGSTQVNFALRAPNENDMYQWKKLANNPTLTVRYSFPVSNPTIQGITNALTCGPTVYARTVRPEFKASAIDYNPTPQQVYIIHRLYKDGVQVGDYGLTQAASGVVQAWTPPFNLTDGTWTYTARAQHATSDGTWQHSPATSSLVFRYDTTAPGGPTLYSATHPDNAPGFGWGATASQGGQIKIKSGETAIAGYSYSWTSSTVPAYSGNTCLSAESIGTASGFVKAANGEATLNLPGLAAGPQSLWVKAIDQAGNQSESVVRYQFYVTPNTNTVVRWEAEALSPAGTAPIATESSWVYSAGSNLRAAATGPGQTLTLTFNVPSSGNWIIQPDMTKGSSNGIIEFAVNGVKVGTTIYDENLNPIIIPAKYDQYRSSTQRYSVPLPDPIALNAGSNTVTITAVGKNTASSGFGFTVDQLRLIKQ